MPEIRPLAEDDLAAVTDLLNDRIPGWHGDERFFREMLFRHPWSDPDTPSLVAVDDHGAVVGFVAAHARRVRFGAESLRGVCCSHLAVAPPPAGGAAGALLLGRLLRGPQAITWSDTAIDPVVRIWRAFGGQLDHARACDWMIVLRPMRWLGSGITTVLRRKSLERVLPVYAAPGHARGYDRPSLSPNLSGKDVGGAEILELMPIGADKWPLVQVDHSVDHLEHVFGLIRSTHGALTCRLVTRKDKPIGWYAYIANSGNPARVLHLAASEENADDVLGELIEHATAAGSAVLVGRHEPHLDGALRRRIAVMGFARRPVIHVRDAELRATFATSASLLTQLDSEWFAT